MMNHNDILYFRIWFKDYVKKFSSTDPEIEANLRYKEGHSCRVRDYILAVAQELDLDKGQMFLAETIGLFHDIGRFEQYVKYRTFKDHQSRDHAELGLIVLEESQIFTDRLSNLEIETAFTAIQNHNKRLICPSVTGNTLLFCQLIRDADKLDIFEQIINFYENPEKTPYLAVESNHEEKGYSPEIIQEILNGQQVSYTSVKTPVDLKLTRLAWLLNLTFAASLEIAQNKRYLARLKAYIPVTADTRRVFQFVEEQMFNRTGRGVNNIDLAHCEA